MPLKVIDSADTQKYCGAYSRIKRIGKEKVKNQQGSCLSIEKKFCPMTLILTADEILKAGPGESNHMGQYESDNLQ